VWRSRKGEGSGTEFEAGASERLTRLPRRDEDTRRSGGAGEPGAECVQLGVGIAKQGDPLRFDRFDLSDARQEAGDLLRITLKAVALLEERAFAQ